MVLSQQINIKTNQVVSVTILASNRGTHHNKQPHYNPLESHGALCVKGMQIAQGEIWGHIA